MIDRFNRRRTYLRISITDRCNLGCVYCNPRLPGKKLHHKEVLRYEEILRLARIGVCLGITKIRITGGEPLVRKGCCDFLDRLAGIDGLTDVSLTTNGVLLPQYLDRIAEAGIKRLNISLDTLNPKKYARITGQDAFGPVWNGIQQALDRGFSPIKINVVAMRGINDDELTDLAALSFTYPVHVRFIELMPIGKAEALSEKSLLIPEIKEKIEPLGDLLPIRRELLDGPAMRYKFPGAPGEIGFISPVSNHFCTECNRLRLTADGHLLTCLLSDIAEDIKTPLRQGLLDNDLKAVFLNAAAKKPHQHPEHLTPLNQPSPMISIGG